PWGVVPLSTSPRDNSARPFSPFPPPAFAPRPAAKKIAKSSSAARRRRHRQSRLGFAVSAGGHFLDMPDELTRAVFPGAAERERATRCARDAKRLDTGHAQVFVQNSDRI